MTRGELRDELAHLETRLEARFDHKLKQIVTRSELRDELDQLETRFDHKLDLWGGALLARIEAGEQRMERMEQRMIASEQRILTELGRHARAIQESLSAQISAIDEKYADLPARVSHLETVVPGLEPR